MKNSDRQDVLDRVENEGFDYAFVHYTSFDEVKDVDFHKARKNFLKARKELADYIGFED